MTDREIGDFINTDRTLVCKWRAGGRTLERDDDSYTVNHLASFFIDRAILERRQARLAEILSLNETDVEADNEACINALVGFMFDGHPVDKAEEKKAPVAPDIETAGNFIGVRGVLDALAILEKRLIDCITPEITVYLSLDYSCLFQDEVAAEIWVMLFRMNRNRPVRVVFDGWMVDDSENVSENLKALLPYILAGKIQLYMIKQAQKYFYHNITFFAKGAGMVITMEPAGGLSINISMLTESPDYVRSMGAVFASLDNLCISFARQIGGTNDEAMYNGKLYESSEVVRMMSNGVNLLYMDEENYLSLLKLNGITGGKRSHRHNKFLKDKQRFEAFIEEHQIKEIISLPELDRMISESKLLTPDFSFHNGEIKADRDIITSLIDGLLGYIEQYNNLSVSLERGEVSQTGFTYRIKGEAYILIHSKNNGDPHMIYSDNWTLVYEYIGQFKDALQSNLLLNTKNAVRTALQLKRERLGGS